MTKSVVDKILYIMATAQSFLDNNRDEKSEKL